MRHGVKDAHGKYVVRPWTTPDGWAFGNPIEFRMYLRQLALGFHGVWDPRPPQEWIEARRDWAGFVRETLEESQSLDTELQVANAVDEGRLSTTTLERWRAVRDTFTIQPKDVWHDDAALEACKLWMERERGIVWCEHRFFARKLAAMTGATYYGANGLSEGGDSITVVKPGRAIIASVQANSAGRNLQMFSTNLVTSCPPSGQTVEQLIGRTHRFGQEADEVTVDVLLGCREHHDAFQRALDGARAAADTLGPRAEAPARGHRHAGHLRQEGAAVAMSSPVHIAIEVSLPLRTRSTLNTREHWRKRAKRAQAERALIRMRLAGVRGWPPALPVNVTLTRVGPRELDDDNLQGACKATRDGVADALGVDDGSEDVQWFYSQEKGDYEVRVKIESKST